MSRWCGIHHLFFVFGRDLHKFGIYFFLIWVYNEEKKKRGMTMSKIIGFVDYYISEWHANNYPAWIKEMCEAHGYDYEIKYAWAEEYVSPVDGRNTDEWCAAFGVEKCNTIAELCEKCDNIIILAPSNPEKHLQYAKEVLKFKKNTYIDKTFAPNLAEAQEIFNIGAQYGTKFFSTSALRYATELKEFTDADNIMTFGGGGSIEEYIIHQVEMIQVINSVEPVAVTVEKYGSQYMCKAEMKDGKLIRLMYAPEFSFAMCADTPKFSIYRTMSGSFFKNLMVDILNFFETGELAFDPAQTINAMKLRDLILKGTQNPGKRIEM